ncbi:hypothetical protein B1R94_22160 [Mycolicibacterium litorale]|nr:hypothetical protein B1R94_22160 [Mycolicibacterium litorale]
MMMQQVCAHGHEQRGPLDYFDDGQCRHCDRRNQARYRTRRSAAMELARALEAHGVEVMRAEPPVDLQRLAEALAGSYKATA